MQRRTFLSWYQEFPWQSSCMKNLRQRTIFRRKCSGRSSKFVKPHSKSSRIKFGPSIYSEAVDAHFRLRCESVAFCLLPRSNGLKSSINEIDGYLKNRGMDEISPVIGEPDLQHKSYFKAKGNASWIRKKIC
ncbi:hypothetical protein CEXT_645161 [Caerostris extrusa]|uniref:Uncharacterized protein n=1 Tax=Caerostris extrusa TaxID=172846 RepID=A0AAV4N6I9_CAEEX|nr:hypothetical protein CEXT_645161 [Caerostris extrusa]